MNPISSLLYWGGVASNIGGSCEAIAFISVGAIGIASFSYVVDRMKFDLDDDKPAVYPWHVVKPLCFVFVGCLLVGSFTPTRETVYAIAASEMGEQALKTPLAGKAEKALEAWLDKQITEKK